MKPTARERAICIVDTYGYGTRSRMSALATIDAEFLEAAELIRARGER